MKKPRAVLPPRRPPHHGQVRTIREDESVPATCDWGDCDRTTILVRYDATLGEWLACCARCSAKPPLRVIRGGAE